MFERYTERARRALFWARAEATRVGGDTIHSGHLLLGLLRDGRGLSGRVLAEAGLSVETVRAAVRAEAPGAGRKSLYEEIPFGEDVRRILDATAAEASRLGHHDIGPEHLLLGLLAESGSLGARLLAENGVRADDVRAQVAGTTALDRERFRPPDP